MTEPKWTAAQRAAIYDQGGSLLVSAAAGSGKTAVLTERAVRLITDPERPVDADKLLIVTFTNAAAAELRARIGQALLRRSQREPANAALRRQRMLLQRAPICTIDAFCLDLLHKNFSALDIPPDFTAADAPSVQAMRAAALAETLEAAYKNADFCAFADLYGKGRTDKAAGETILNIYDFLRALPDYNKKLDEFLAPWQEENSFSRACWHDLLLSLAAADAAAARELLCAALADLQQDLAAARREAADNGKDAFKVNDKFAAPLEQLERSATLCGEVERLAKAGQWDDLYAKLTPYALGSEPMPGLKGVRLTGERHSAVRLRAGEATALFERILEYISCSEAEAEADRRAALPLLSALFSAVKDFDERFAAKKREKRMLEFSDFEHEALRLLRAPDGQPTPLCQTIRQSYAAVMVDEYQDTNALQDSLYRCLASPAGDNLFLVGDLKQSIYRFRQADPSIFRQKMSEWPPLAGGAARALPPEGQCGVNAQLALDANFRSAPQVVEGINFIFGQLLTPALGDTAYGAGQRLVCGSAGSYEGSVEAHFLTETGPEAEAGLIAGRIQRLVASGERVRCEGGERQVEYGDCCILLPVRTNFKIYAAALSARGIPVYADSRENLFDAPHIRPLIALLRVIDNPAQDVYLAAVMLGPMFGFADDDLVKVRAACGEKKLSLYGALLAAKDDANSSKLGEELSAKIRAFCARLDELRSLARSVSAECLLEEIYASTGYLAVLGAMENGQRRREDAQRFAAFCASAGAGGISALVRAVDAAAAAAGEAALDSAPGGARAGCVTIMTIHRSKGLQFPVVFVAGCERRFNASDTYRPVLLHREYGAGLRLRPAEGASTYKTAAYTALSNVYMQELRSEQMRLLYVALTRAQDKLVITAPLGVTKSTNALARAAVFLAAGAGETLNRQALSFGAWVRAALLVHPNGGPLRRAAGYLELPFAKTNSRIDIVVHEAAQSEPEPAAAPPPSAGPDTELTARLLAGFKWRYPAAGLANVPAKVSVTGLVHKTEQTALERPAFLYKDGLTAAEMGTALHAFLEHADFAALAAAKQQGGAALAAAIHAESERQVSARLTSPETAARLDEQKIRRFVESEAFGRIRAADKVLREYAFITALPAAEVLAAQGTPGAPEAAAGAEVLVQGIADIVLIYADHVELLDYKTDRGKTEAGFLSAYRAQLELYARAIEKRFEPLRVTYKGIYSLELGRLIEVK